MYNTKPAPARFPGRFLSLMLLSWAVSSHAEQAPAAAKAPPGPDMAEATDRDGTGDAGDGEARSSGSEAGVAAGPGAESPEVDVFPLPRVAVRSRPPEAPPTLVIRQVSAEDIRARNAHTVGDALVHVPGVNVQVGGSSSDARAWVRGYRDRDVLVLYDGIPIASGFEGTVDLNEIATQRVGRINVIKSAPSVIYGVNGVGGVIDIEPLEGLADPFGDGLVEAGTDGRLLGRGAIGGGDGNQSWVVSLQYQSADDYRLSSDYTGEINQPAGDRVNSDFERSSAFFQYDVADWALGHTTVFLNLADGEKGLPVQAGVEEPDFERLTESRRQTLGISNHFNGLPLSLKLYYNAYDSELSVFEDAGFALLDEVETNEDYSYGARAYSTLNLSERHTLVLSAGGQKDHFEGEGELEDGNQAELATWNLAIEDEFVVTETLSVAMGGIFTLFDQTLLGRSETEFNPQVAVAWQAAPAWSLHASAAQRTRFPKLRELYRRRYGNPDLAPQEAENYELGFVLTHRPGWTTDAAVFRSDIDGLIERAERDGTYVNYDPVTIDGVELYSGGWLTEQVYARLGYTWVRADEKLPDGSSRPLRSRPRHTVVGEFRYRFVQDVELALSAIWASDLYDLDESESLVRLPSFTVVDLKASWDLSPRWELYLDASNLLDEDYVHRLGYPREGRAWVAGVSLSW